MRDFTNIEIFNLVKMTGKLMATGNEEKLDDFLQKVRQVVYERRLAKCMKILGSKMICQDNVNFFIWAKNIAKKIMAGEDI